MYSSDVDIILTFPLQRVYVCNASTGTIVYKLPLITDDNLGAIFTILKTEPATIIKVNVSLQYIQIRNNFSVMSTSYTFPATSTSFTLCACWFADSSRYVWVQIST